MAVFTIEESFARRSSTVAFSSGCCCSLVTCADTRPRDSCANPVTIVHRIALKRRSILIVICFYLKAQQKIACRLVNILYLPGSSISGLICPLTFINLSEIYRLGERGAGTVFRACPTKKTYEPGICKRRGRAVVARGVAHHQCADDAPEPGKQW